jgi:MFS transporter, DHA1 family, multidrug resistance protein
MMGASLVAPILPLYALEFGVNYTAAGGLITGFAVARLSFDVIGGVAGDRLGARRVTMGGALLIAVAGATAALAPSYWFLLLSRFVEGVGSALFATAAFQYLVQITERSRLGRAAAMYQTGMLVGFAIGPFAGGYLAQIGDFRTPFWAYAVFGIIVAVISGTFIDDLPPSGRTVGEVVRGVGLLIRRREMQVLSLVAVALFIMRAGARITLFPLYGDKVAKLDPGSIGTILSASAITNLLIVNYAGRLVDRVGRKPVAIWGLVASGIMTAAYGLFQGFWSLLLVSAVFGIASGIASIPPPAMVGDLAPQGLEGSAVGLYRMAGDLGFVIGPLLVGVIADTGAFSMGFFASGIALLIAAGAMLTIRETHPREASA